MEKCIFHVAPNFSDAGGIRRTVLPPGGTDTCTLRGEDCQYCGTFHAISEIVLSRPSDNVILRRQPKNLEILRPPLGGTQDDNYSLRGACPELAEGLRMTEAGISGVVGQPLEAD